MPGSDVMKVQGNLILFDSPPPTAGDVLPEINTQQQEV